MDVLAPERPENFDLAVGEPLFEYIVRDRHLHCCLVGWLASNGIEPNDCAAFAVRCDAEGPRIEAVLAERDEHGRMYLTPDDQVAEREIVLPLRVPLPQELRDARVDWLTRGSFPGDA